MSYCGKEVATSVLGQRFHTRKFVTSKCANRKRWRSAPISPSARKRKEPMDRSRSGDEAGASSWAACRFQTGGFHWFLCRCKQKCALARLRLATKMCTRVASLLSLKNPKRLQARNGLRPRRAGKVGTSCATGGIRAAAAVPLRQVGSIFKRFAFTKVDFQTEGSTFCKAGIMISNRSAAQPALRKSSSHHPDAIRDGKKAGWAVLLLRAVLLLHTYHNRARPSAKARMGGGCRAARHFRFAARGGACVRARGGTRPRVAALQCATLRSSAIGQLPSSRQQERWCAEVEFGTFPQLAV